MLLRDYRELKVWQVAMDLAQRAYRVSGTFPTSERFILAAQMQRAAISIPSNIAEGHARDSTREFLRFISVAMGSLAELETQLLLAQRLEYLSAAEADEVMGCAAEVGRMLRGLQQSLKSRIDENQ